MMYLARQETQIPKGCHFFGLFCIYSCCRNEICKNYTENF